MNLLYQKFYSLSTKEKEVFVRHFVKIWKWIFGQKGQVGYFFHYNQFLFIILGFSPKGFENSLERGNVFLIRAIDIPFAKEKTALFSLHKRKEPKEVCNLAG